MKSVSLNTVHPSQWRTGCRSIVFLMLILTVFLSPSVIMAADEVVNFDNPEHKQMYQSLLKEYRCLKCQNQNLWDSNASLAGDLRREIREQILDGQSKTDIDDYLVSRYGDFVLYRPRFNAKTAVLWIGPFVLLLIGLLSVVLMVRGKSGKSEIAVSENHSGTSNPSDRLSRARDLLKDQ